MSEFSLLCPPSQKDISPYTDTEIRRQSIPDRRQARKVRKKYNSPYT